MLIEIPPQPNKQYQKLINKLNEMHTKEKWEKFREQFDELHQLLAGNPQDANVLLYILSIIAEVLPQYISQSVINTITRYLKEGGVKEKTNAVIIIGSYLIRRLKEPKIGNAEIEEILPQLTIFLDFLSGGTPEIRQNIIIFLDQIAEAPVLDTFFLTKLNFFLDVLKTEEHENILSTIFKILRRIQKELSLSILLTYIKNITQIYADSTVPAKSDMILRLLELEIPVLKEREKKHWDKKENLNRIAQRLPLTRLYNIAKVAKQEKMDEPEVEENLLGAVDEEKSVAFPFSEKSQKFILELEKEPLITYFDETKQKLDDSLKLFEPIGVKNQSVLVNIIKELLKKKLLKGFISGQYYYPEHFLHEEIITRLQRQGFIQVSTYTSFLSDKYVQNLIAQLADQGNYAGVFEKKKENYYTFNYITKEIEQNVVKSNTIDLGPYSEKFEYEDFLRIEEYCRKNYFTPVHLKHIWMTNLGFTRIQTYLRTSEQIGMFEIQKASDSLLVPEQLVINATKETFEHTNGFWNESKTIFYYAKYVKLQISKIQTQKDPARREAMIQELATKLQIPKDEITKKVDEKLNKIGEMLKAKDEFEINPVLKDLQMDYQEFIVFIDGLDKAYLVMGGKIIFNADKIKEEREKLKGLIATEAKQKNLLVLGDLANRVKCAKQMVAELLTELIQEQAIHGLWLEKNAKFLTESGIERRMIDAQGFIDLGTFIDRDLEPGEFAFLETVIKRLVETHKLDGVYTNGVFQNEEMAGESNLILERERFSNEIATHLKELERTYDILKDIFLQNDISPSDMERYEGILDETLRNILQTEPYLKRVIANADRNITGKYRKEDRSKAGKRDRRSRVPVKAGEKAEEEDKGFAGDEVVTKLMGDYANWKTLIIAIQQKAGQIVFLKKKLKVNSQDSESFVTMKGIFEYLGFLD